MARPGRLRGEHRGGPGETYDALSPAFADRRWLNYLVVEGENDDRVREVYGPNYDRLVKVKNEYDPANLFHHNLNIRPST